MTARLTVAALAACLAMPAAASTCDWNAGSNRFTGSARWAVAQMQEIPLQRRALLAVRVGTAAPTDRIRIYQDRIESDAGLAYQPGVFDMRFGAGQICNEVGMAHWPADKFETANVWCVGRSCVAVPQVCDNVARVFLEDRPQTAPHRVPEPNDLWLALIALACGGIVTWINRRNT